MTKKRIFFFSLLGLSAVLLLFSYSQEKPNLFFSQQNIVEDSASCPKTPLDRSGAVEGLAPGCFDYYVFAQMWLPESCIAEKNSGYVTDKKACQVLFKEFDGQLKPHGLWNNSDALENQVAYITNCTDEPFDFEALPLSVRRTLNMLYLSQVPKLKGHEWKKHGTCDGTSQAVFFQKIIDYNQHLVASSSLISESVGKGLLYEDLIDEYGGEGFASLECHQYNHGQYLNQVFTFWSKKGKPIKKAMGSSKTCDPSQLVYIRKPGQFISKESWKDQINQTHQKPIKVGFDIDDTVLFSSPGFYYLLNYLNLDLDKPIFWEKLNGGLDEFSLPKKIGEDLIKFHQDRGDEIYFITKRASSPDEKVTGVLRKLNWIKGTRPVVFTELQDKTPYIRDRNLDVYYGDADNDILAAREANAQGIRIIRSKGSTNYKPTFNGAFGEIVILDSSY